MDQFQTCTRLRKRYNLFPQYKGRLLGVHVSVTPYFLSYQTSEEPENRLQFTSFVPHNNLKVFLVNLVLLTLLFQNF